MVRVYTIKDCPYCSELKEILKNENVDYTEIDVDNPINEEEFKKLTDFTKSYDVPQIKVNKHVIVPGVSFQTIREAADLTKKFLI